MFTPTRLAYAIKPHAPIPIMAAAVALAAMFAATPFLIPEIASRYGVSQGSAGFISVVQVGAFAISSFALPKVLAPSGRLLRIAGIVFLLSNVASIFLSVFWLLVAVRLVAGFAAGVVTWMVWVEAMGDRRSLSSISSIGPMTALIGAPILAVVAASGDRYIYGVLALVALPAALMKIDTSGVAKKVRKVSRSRSNRVLLFALALATMAGSSLFVYAAVAAFQELGLSPSQASIGYSLNAAAGLAGARLAGRHRRPGWFLASTAQLPCSRYSADTQFGFSLGWHGGASGSGWESPEFCRCCHSVL